MTKNRDSKPFIRKHSLSLATLGVVMLLIVLYSKSNPSTHIGSFFGNAIADWTGVFVTVLMTKHLYEKGSSESKQPKGILPSAVMEFLREHSLTIFLLITGAAWVMAFKGMDPNSRWGQVVGNIISEWTQILGLVLMTKRLIEVGSKSK
ncbi:MAG TPA: hypothetical protein VI386_07845 [Candidatus Sulfotelmatobacter sp.]